jgi:tellurite resistance protein TerC
MTMVWLWSGFFVLVAVLLALDLFVFHRKPGEVSLRAAVGWSAFWIALGLLFSIVVYVVYENHFQGIHIDRTGVGDEVSDGWLAVLRYLTAYVVEKSLSLDNIFVMVAVFGWFKVAARDQHRVLFWGILGAIVARASLLATGVWLVRRFTWTFYIFGAILAVTGVRMLLKKDEGEGPEDSRIVRFLRRHLPIAKGDHPGAFVTRENGRVVLTTLALALMVIEISDLVFAVDSVPAVLSVSTDTFILITSNVFAILGLRSLYFVLAHMILRFRYLEPAMALLLVTIGTKMLLHDVFKVPNLVSLVAILGIVTAGILASFVVDRARPAG